METFPASRFALLDDTLALIAGIAFFDRHRFFSAPFLGQQESDRQQVARQMKWRAPAYRIPAFWRSAFHGVAELIGIGPRLLGRP